MHNAFIQTRSLIGKLYAVYKGTCAYVDRYVSIYPVFCTLYALSIFLTRWFWNIYLIKNNHSSIYSYIRELIIPVVKKLYAFFSSLPSNTDRRDDVFILPSLSLERCWFIIAFISICWRKLVQFIKFRNSIELQLVVISAQRTWVAFFIFCIAA